MLSRHIMSAARFWFVLTTTAWIILVFGCLIFNIILLAPFYIKGLLFVSSISCLIYLPLGIHFNDFGESEEDYKQRCKDAGIDINDNII